MRKRKMNRRYVAPRYRRHGRRVSQFLTILVLVLAVSGAIFLTYAKKGEPEPVIPDEYMCPGVQKKFNATATAIE